LNIFVTRNGKKTLPRSLIVKILIFIGLIVISALVIQPFQAAVTSSMRHIREDIIKKAEELTGLQIFYSSMRPSLFGAIEIRNLRLMQDEYPLLTVSGVKVRFSIFELFLRKKTFIHTILMDKPVFNIDAQRDKEIIDYVIFLLKTDDSLLEIIHKISQLFPGNIDYLIRNCTINIVDNNNFYKAENMNLSLWGKDEQLFLTGRFILQTISDLFDNRIIFNSVVGINAVFNSTLDDGKADLMFYSLSCSQEDTSLNVFNPVKAHEIFNINPVSISFLFKDKIISIEPHNNETSSFNYLFNYNAETYQLLTEINFINFMPANFINISEKYNYANQLLQMQITGGVKYSTDNGNADYNIKLSSNNILNSVNDFFIIDFYGNKKSITVNNINLSLSDQRGRTVFFQGEVKASGRMEFEKYKADGKIAFNRFSLTGKESLSSVFDISSRDGEIQISSSVINAAKTKLTDINLFIYPSQKDIAISFSTFLNNNGSVYADAVYNLNPKELEASLVLASASLFDITESIRPFADYLNLPFLNTFLHNTLIDAQFFYSTNFSNTLFNAPNIALDINGSPGRLSLSATNNQVTLSEGVFNIGENEFQITADFNYSDSKNLEILASASYLDLAWHVDGQLFDGNTLVISESNGLNIYGNITNSGAISGYIETVDFPLYINNRIVHLGAFINLRYNSESLWNLNIDSLTAREQNAVNGNELLRISGEADQRGAFFNELIYTDNLGTLKGNAAFAWDEKFSYLDFNVNINDNYDREKVFLEGGLMEEKVRVNASVSELRINRFIKESESMLLTAEAVVDWDSIDSFQANINVEKFDAILPKGNILGNGNIVVDNKELTINDLFLDIAGLQTNLPLLQINCSQGEAEANASLSGFAFRRALEGNVKLNANFAKVDSWFDISNALKKLNGTLRIDNLVYNNEKQDPFLFAFSADNGAVSVSGGIKDMLRLEMDNAGNFFAGLSAPMPIRGSIIGTYKNGNIDAKCNNFYFDVSSLWSLMVSMKGFSVSSGYITGSLDIRGPVLNPEFYGNARGTIFRFNVPDFINDDIRPVPFNITAQGYEMTFGPVVATAGMGGGIVNGWFLFDSWIPVGVGLDIDVPRDKPIPYDFKIFGFLANGNVSGKLKVNVDSTNELMELTGDLFTNDAEMGMNMDESKVASEDESNRSSGGKILNAVLDLKITLGSKVEFLWPTTTPILRATPEIGTIVNVSSDARAGIFSLNSDVKVRSGELFYFDRSFYIKQGMLIFKESEGSFDPKFTARAELRDRTDSGPVTISMVVENQPLLSFEPRFEASPTLSQLEIYSVLGQNVNSGQGLENPDTAQRFLLASTTDILTQLVATSDVFSQFAFLRLVERQIKGFLGLDVFTFRTRLLQNAVVTGASAIGQDNFQFNRVGNFFDNTSVSIGKYVGQNMFIQGMLTLRYDENSDKFGGLKLEPDIGIELQSPYFTIRWDFFPYSPQNWWVNDNSITLTWSKSF